MAARSRATSPLLAAALAVLLLLAQAHGRGLRQEDLAAPAPAAEAAAAAPASTEAALPPSSYDGVSIDGGSVLLDAGEQACNPADAACWKNCIDTYHDFVTSGKAYDDCTWACESVCGPACVYRVAACAASGRLPERQRRVTAPRPPGPTATAALPPAHSSQAGSRTVSATGARLLPTRARWPTGLGS